MSTRRSPLTALMVALGISGVGDCIYLTTLPVLVWQATGDAALVGLVAAARLLPCLGLSIPGGRLVDRLGPRRELLMTESACAVAMFGATAVAITSGDLRFIAALVLVATAASAIALPAHGACSRG